MDFGQIFNKGVTKIIGSGEGGVSVCQMHLAQTAEKREGDFEIFDGKSACRNISLNLLKRYIDKVRKKFINYENGRISLTMDSLMEVVGW